MRFYPLGIDSIVLGFWRSGVENKDGSMMSSDTLSLLKDY